MSSVAQNFQLRIPATRMMSSSSQFGGGPPVTRQLYSPIGQVPIYSGPPTTRMLAGNLSPARSVGLRHPWAPSGARLATGHVVGLASTSTASAAAQAKLNPSISHVNSVGTGSSPTAIITGVRQSTHPIYPQPDPIPTGGSYRTPNAGFLPTTGIASSISHTTVQGMTAQGMMSGGAACRFGGEQARHKAFLASHPDARVTAITERSGQEQVIGEYVVEHEIKVPKKTVREELIERTYVVPERVVIEEIVEDTQFVRECIVEVAQPVIQEKIVQVPEVEYIERVVEVPQKLLRERVREVPRVEIQERIIEVPRIVTKEKNVDVPVYEYHEVPVEKVVEVPEIHEEIVLREIPVPQYVDKPVKEERNIEVEQNVDRRIPVPVESVTKLGLVLPRIRPNYSKHEVPVYVPRFVEYPLQAEFCNEELLDKADRASQEVARLMDSSAIQPLSLCALEETAGMVQNLEFERLVAEQNAMENFAYWWRLNKIDIDVESLKSICQTVDSDGKVVVEAVSMVATSTLPPAHIATTTVAEFPMASHLTIRASGQPTQPTFSTAACKITSRLGDRAREPVQIDLQRQQGISSEQMFPEMIHFDKQDVEAPLPLASMDRSHSEEEEPEMLETAGDKEIDEQIAEQGEKEGDLRASSAELDTIGQRGEAAGAPPAFGSSAGSSVDSDEPPDVRKKEIEGESSDRFDDDAGMPEVTFIDDGHPSLYTSPSAENSDL